MRVLAIAALLLITAGFADGQQTVRQVDFKNFTYPLSGPLLAHDHLQWLDPAAKRHIRLHDGRDAGFTLTSVEFANLTADSKEEAIVVLHYDTGGTQQTDYIYIYSFDSGGLKLLAYCYTGDRADSGLYKVYGRDGKLVVELHDLRKAIGVCCSSGFIRTRYEWKNGKFIPSARHEYGAIELQEYSNSGEPIKGTGK